MGIIVLNDDPPKEDASYRITGTFRDLAGVAIPAADLDSAKIWLKNKTTDATINGRNGTDILNSGPGTVDASGKLTLDLVPADNPIVDSTKNWETHILTIEWTWNAGAKKSHEEIHLPVRNAKHVPTAA